MPENFKMTFPSTRCIIDCTELFCQKPSSLRHQSSLYSSYKHHVTYKGLLGISPLGAITFILTFQLNYTMDLFLTKKLLQDWDTLIKNYGTKMIQLWLIVTLPFQII
jgi:hypothetical protein